MNNEKLLISDNRSNNSEFKSNKPIEEMAEYIFGNAITHDTRFKEDCRSIARDLYNASYRKQEWISVDERLPTEQKDFLVYYGFDRGDGNLGMMFTGVLTYFAYDKKPHFQYEKSGAGLRVTHWMPLPEAPKMKGE